MTQSLSANTQATLLLTAPLVAGREDESVQLLSPGEYVKLKRLLGKFGLHPEDLLNEPVEPPNEIKSAIDNERYHRLLARRRVGRGHGGPRR